MSQIIRKKMAVEQPFDEIAGRVVLKVDDVSSASSGMSKDIQDDIEMTMENTVPLSLVDSLCCILTDAIDQFHILGSNKYVDDDVLLYNLRNVEERAEDFHYNDPVFDKKSAELFIHAFNRKKLQKVVEDSSFIKFLLTYLKFELKENYTYNTLANIMNDMRKIKDEENSLMIDEVSNFNKMIQLKHRIETEQRDSLVKLQQLNEETAKLKDQNEDILFTNLIRARYADDWEKARTEQNEAVINMNEQQLTNVINKFKNEIEKEVRVNEEIEQYISENQNEMEDAIEMWMSRYDSESEQHHIDIATFKEMRADLAIAFADLNEMYDLHEQEIEAYLIHKEELRIEAERIAFLSIHAVKIQAWWRGLMVRCKLGRFNPDWGKKKKKGKKGKKGKKDKKKKK